MWWNSNASWHRASPPARKQEGMQPSAVPQLIRHPSARHQACGFASSPGPPGAHLSTLALRPLWATWMRWKWEWSEYIGSAGVGSWWQGCLLLESHGASSWISLAAVTKALCPGIQTTDINHLKDRGQRSSYQDSFRPTHPERDIPGLLPSLHGLLVFCAS